MSLNLLVVFFRKTQEHVMWPEIYPQKESELCRIKIWSGLENKIFLSAEKLVLPFGEGHIFTECLILCSQGSR